MNDREIRDLAAGNTATGVEVALFASHAIAAIAMQPGIDRKSLLDTLEMLASGQKAEKQPVYRALMENLMRDVQWLLEKGP